MGTIWVLFPSNQASCSRYATGSSGDMGQNTSIALEIDMTKTNLELNKSLAIRNPLGILFWLAKFFYCLEVCLLKLF